MREICKKCNYPISMCVCSAVVAVTSPIRVVVLQHTQEYGHAKNTVKLLKLGLKPLTIVKGNKAKDFIEIEKELKNSNSVVIFPSENSIAMEHAISVNDGKPDVLILLDGSWKKSFAIWKINPWLHSFPQWHFSSALQTRYSIRKTSKQNSVSTLEATAYCLSEIYNVNTTPLLVLFEKFLDNWKRHVKEN